MDNCLSEAIASFDSHKTLRNENEDEGNTGRNNTEDGEVDIAISKAGEKSDVSKSKVMTTLYVHEIDGFAIAEMGYQGDDEAMESESITGKIFNRLFISAKLKFFWLFYKQAIFKSSMIPIRFLFFIISNGSKLYYDYSNLITKISKVCQV